MQFIGAGALIALMCVGMGCGGSGGESSAAGSSLSKAQWLERANRICAQGTKELGRLDAEAWKKLDPAHGHASAAIEDEVAYALLPAREEELRRLRALGTPRGDEVIVEKIYDAWEKGIRGGREDHRSLRTAGSGFAFYKSYSMSIAYGLEKCWLG